MNALLTQSYSRGPTDTPLIEQTIGDFFDAMVERQPEREALVSRHEDRRLTYRQLHKEANRLASALLRLGLAPGDRVGIWSHNNVPWVLLQIATAKTGLILVNINPAYRVAELEYALNKVDCKVLVTMPRFKTSNYLNILRELAPELERARPGALAAQRLPHLRIVVWLDQPGHGGNEPGTIRFSDLMASGDPQDARLAQIQRAL
ncbi:MAG: AMP-binding protein, partial [Rhodanobacter sp.]|nr:AMP-binding protein [Rhodanobacter sp.]